MSEFLNAAFALPTAFYSVSLLFVLAYWMLAIVGLFDLDTADASVETGGEVDLDGPDLDMDMDLDGPDLDMDLDGPNLDMDLDGPDLDMDMDMDGPDLDMDMDLDGPELDMDLDGPDLDLDLDGPDLDGPALDGLEGTAHSMSAFARVFSALGFHRVPLTISISFIVFFRLDVVLPRNGAGRAAPDGLDLRADGRFCGGGVVFVRRGSPGECRGAPICSPVPHPQGQHPPLVYRTGV
jgi:hypothetical protein